MVPELAWRSSPAPALARCTAWSSPASPPAASPTDPGRRCCVRHHQRRHEARRQGLGLKAVVDKALAECPTVTTNLVVRHTGEAVDWTERRDVLQRPDHRLRGRRRSGWPRRPALHPLHLRQHGAQGRGPHCGATWSTRATALPTSSSTSLATCTGAPPTSAGSPATATSSTDRCSTRHDRHVRGRPTWPAGPFLGGLREAPRQPVLHRPTAIGPLMACPPSSRGHDLSALKVIGSVGSPSTRRRQWYHDVIGGGQCASSTPGGRPRRAAS